MNSIFLKKINIHSDWADFLTPDRIKLIEQVEKEVVKSNYTPTPDKVLRFLTVPLSKVRIIILGQDPYPQEGIATGRSFEVGILKSWNQPFNNISLKNILRSIYKAYTGNVIKFNEMKPKFDNEFPMLPPDKLFASWEEQGVLLLNTYFTCEIGQPGSHKEIWEDFSTQLFQYINQKNKEIIWFLWGTHAINSVQNLPDIKSVASMHPMMCFDKPGRDTDFLYGKINCFEQHKESINWTGYSIDSNLKTSNTLF